MDRNSAIGLFLISALLIIYLYVVPHPKPTDEAKKPAQTTAAAPAAAATATPAPLDSVAAAKQLGAFGAAGVGTAQTTELKNDNITITFNSKGGRVEAVRLNKYKTFFGKPLDLLDAQSAQIDTRFRTTDGRQVKLSDLYFRPEPQGNNALRFVAEVAGGQIEQLYTLPANSFELSYNLRFNNLSSVVAQEPLTFTFLDHVRQTEQDMKQNRNHTTINRYLVSGDHTALAETSEKPEEIKVTEPLKWVAHKHDFFVAGIIADNQFQSGQL
jgi:YidC/Oxa1 family membrane protein insertase